ncbi:hypothetical protein OSB04_017198, partial [Centaurea solstitialis]
MDYPHPHNIIHRDLEAANLLMDENDERCLTRFQIIVHYPKVHVMFLIQVVKVADFGVARVKSQTGVMTAETGTYRLMVP